MKATKILSDQGENLPVFDELAEITQEPTSRKIIESLTAQYPSLLAKLL